MSLLKRLAILALPSLILAGCASGPNPQFSEESLEDMISFASQEVKMIINGNGAKIDMEFDYSTDGKSVNFAAKYEMTRAVFYGEKRMQYWVDFSSTEFPNKDSMPGNPDRLMKFAGKGIGGEVTDKNIYTIIYSQDGINADFVAVYSADVSGNLFGTDKAELPSKFLGYAIKDESGNYPFIPVPGSENNSPSPGYDLVASR
ncbi:MAG TPA: hypothetical protein VMC07_01885 [Candidatus Omnitrophota bacterium]|nr:hypothetical protein [Candidatus Omnitrophota bacterium]